MSEPVTVAVPVLDGGPRLARVLAAVRDQELERPLELLVADSGSTDGSLEVARAHGARILPVAPGSFSHGGTRNELVRAAQGTHVAFLTQDALPLGREWLSRLLDGFELASDVGLVFGPYLAQPGASHWVRRELADFFAAMAPGGAPVVQRAPREPGWDRHPTALTFFSDANGCVARWAWERVPYRTVAYAEDQMLALDMLRAGFAKVYAPGAAVEHSHELGASAQFRRFFDEWRGLREVYGHVEPAAPRWVASRVRREVRADRALLRGEGVRGGPLARATLQSLRFQLLRAAAAALGSRADRLPPAVRRVCSLEGRGGFEPVEHPPRGEG
jgi:rhamnosyltransferase